ncbi:MAG: hypothetical protein JW749_01025 [Sedimentisphaerales bacterium]|nr:hypothetical protein [Sedimentisphaerales bacterium]
MKTGQFSLIRIAKLLAISVLCVLALLYIDYTYGLRRAPKSLARQSKTEHFHIYADVDEKTLRHYENFFEGFYDYFNKEYFEIGQRRPLKVYLFSDVNSYGPYMLSVRGPRTPYGFYMGTWSNIIVVNRESGLGTTTHELVHHYIRTSFARPPAEWAEEGICVFFEKFIGHFDEDGELNISFGYFSNWRFPITKKFVKWLSLDDLVTTNMPDQGIAGALMLFLHKKGLFKEFVGQLRQATDDPNGVATLEKVYGKPLSVIEKDLQEWVRNQPIDEDVNLVQESFVLPADKWQIWLQENNSRLYWDENQQIYRVRK